MLERLATEINQQGQAGRSNPHRRYYYRNLCSPANRAWNKLHNESPPRLEPAALNQQTQAISGTAKDTRLRRVLSEQIQGQDSAGLAGQLDTSQQQGPGLPFEL